jgi:2-amino-4-hydroxy-6-hydroxymethyldihydropteridine diphosphokinase
VRTGPATPVAIALGSNVGEREEHLRRAIDSLSSFLTRIRPSRFIETEPENLAPQPLFLNAAVVAVARLRPADLLERLLAVERERGRERPYAGAPRTLDLDLILYGDAVIETATLTVPHPRFRERRFVLEPLAQVAPEMVDPVTGLTVRELLDRLRGRRLGKAEGGR